MKRSGLERLETLVSRRLSQLESLQRLRRLRPLLPGIDLTHNDYLGFRNDATFQACAWQAARSWPLGSGASRLLGGEHLIYAELETQFSRWKGCEASLYFPSGYAANEALMTVLAFEEVCFFSDSLNHASLIDGLRLAKINAEQKQIFAHNDLDDLRRRLQASSAALKIIVTESLFSMDGDFAPVTPLQKLADETGSLLILDEAHTLGAYGEQGRGLIDDHRSIISINPCGKAMGASGAFISGPIWLRDLLISSARSFIYTTAPSPWIAAALNACIPMIVRAEQRRQHLQTISDDLRSCLRQLGFNLGASHSHIIPVILGSEAKALHAEQYLARREIHARAIRPPTVAEDSCRLRLSLHAGLSSQDIAKLKEAMQGLAHEI